MVCLVGLVCALGLQAQQDEVCLPGCHLWSKRFGDTGFDLGQAVAVDGSGDVVVTGPFEGTVDFGGGPLTSAGGFADIFIAKFSGVDGSHLWSKSFGGAHFDLGVGVAVDGSGDVLVTGIFEEGTVDFGGGPLAITGGFDMFLAKFSGVDGSHLWSKSFGDTGMDEGLAVAVDGSGDVLVTGLFEGTVDFGGGPLTSGGGGFSIDIFLAKFSGVDGSHLWSKRFGGGGFESGVAIAVDASANVLVMGFFLATVDFGGGPLTHAGGFSVDIFLAKFSGVDGSHLWSKRLGDRGLGGFGMGVAVDVSSDVLVTGPFVGTVDFGGGSLASAGSNDIFLAKFSGVDGSHLWSKRFGDTGGDHGLGVALDGSRDVLVTGLIQGTVDFGGGPLTSAGGFSDIFLAKFSGVDGSHLWSKSFGDTGSDFGIFVALDGSGDVLGTGLFEGTVDFGGGPLTSAGRGDIFLVKLSGTGISPVLEVEIDIKPGSDPNAINPAAKGLTPVAILTTDTFDATTVSPITVRFGPAGANLEHQLGHLEDVDSDGDLDLVLHFRTQESGIQCGDTEASLAGETFDGQAIQGLDSIVTVGCN
jgi:hypothetical protein